MYIHSHDRLLMLFFSFLAFSLATNAYKHANFARKCGYASIINSRLL